MIFQAHVAASASEVSIVKKRSWFYLQLFCPRFLCNRPNKCNEHQMLHRNVINDCVEEIYQILFFFAETLWLQRVLLLFFFLKRQS